MVSKRFGISQTYALEEAGGTIPLVTTHRRRRTAGVGQEQSTVFSRKKRSSVPSGMGLRTLASTALEPEVGADAVKVTATGQAAFSDSGGGTELLVEHSHHGKRLGACHRVKDVLALTARGNETIFAKHGQLLR